MAEETLELFPSERDLGSSLQIPETNEDPLDFFKSEELVRESCSPLRLAIAEQQSNAERFRAYLRVRSSVVVIFLVVAVGAIGIFTLPRARVVIVTDAVADREPLVQTPEAAQPPALPRTSEPDVTRNLRRQVSVDLRPSRASVDAAPRVAARTAPVNRDVARSSSNLPDGAVATEQLPAAPPVASHAVPPLVPVASIISPSMAPASTTASNVVTSLSVDLPATAIPPNGVAPPLAPPPAAGLHDTGAIQTVLGRYRAAFNGLDTHVASEVWPTVDVRALDRAFSRLEEQELQFDSCQIAVSGSRAVASCAGRTRYVPKVGNKSSRIDARQWKFNLLKVNRDWVIEAVDTR